MNAIKFIWKNSERTSSVDGKGLGVRELSALMHRRIYLVESSIENHKISHRFTVDFHNTETPVEGKL